VRGRTMLDAVIRNFYGDNTWDFAAKVMARL
jgi:hypothetical protein